MLQNVILRNDPLLHLKPKPALLKKPSLAELRLNHGSHWRMRGEIAGNNSARKMHTLGAQTIKTVQCPQRIIEARFTC